MKKLSILFADGCEEIEGLTVVDLARRAGIGIDGISIKEETEIRGSHGIIFQADTCMSRAMGTAFAFGLAIVAYVRGEEAARRLGQETLYD